MTQAPTTPAGEEDDAFPDELDPATPEPGLTPAAEGSVLADLRTRRERAKAALTTDLEVPRLDPPVYVRFKPPTQARIDAANQRARNGNDKDATVLANAIVIADSCVGVFEIIDGEKVSVDPTDRDGTWPLFDKRLARLLGVPAGRAADVVRALYLTDGDVLSTSAKLAEWSGFATEQLELDEGN